MVIIADITIPADHLESGYLFENLSGARIEFEQIVPLQQSTFPLLWVSGEDSAEIETTLREHPLADRVTLITATDEETLLEVQWNSDIDGVVRTLLESDAHVLRASGTTDGWEFRLRFRSHQELSAFNMRLTDSGIPVTLRQLHNPTPTTDAPLLSDEQHRAVSLAHRRGFFEIPRQVTLSELAAELEISDSAFSQRLRRGLSTIVDKYLGEEQTTQGPVRT